MRISGYNSDSIASLFSGFHHTTSGKSSLSNFNSYDGFGDFTSVLSEYNSVKSGSYYKLLKKYYAQDNSTNTANRSQVSQRTSLSDVKGTVSKAVVTVAEDATDLTNSLKKLRDKDLYQKDVKEIYSAVKDYVSDYNDMVRSGERSKVSGVASNTAKLVNMSSYNEADLAKIGISIKEDHTLALDEETFSKADSKDVETLFTGPGYGSAQETNTSLIRYYAQAAASTGSYEKNGTYSAPSAYDFSSYI